MCIYTLLVHMHTCVYIYMFCTMSIHILSTSGCHFFNVLKTMNVCVQNTVFLRRISDRFFLLLFCIRWVHFKHLDGKKPDNPRENPARPSLNVQVEISPLSHLCSLQVIPCGENRMLMKKNGPIFSTYIYYLLESILNPKLFQNKISLG